MKKFLPRNIKRYNRQIPGNTKLTPEDAENMNITVQPVKSVVKQRENQSAYCFAITNLNIENLLV